MAHDTLMTVYPFIPATAFLSSEKTLTQTFAITNTKLTQMKICMSFCFLRYYVLLFIALVVIRLLDAFENNFAVVYPVGKVRLY